MSQTSPVTETLIEHYAFEWKRQIINAGGDEALAVRIIALADVNGLFDPIGHAQCQQDLRGLLLEAQLQIDYLHKKFQPTGTGEATLARIRAALTDTSTTRESRSKRANPFCKHDDCPWPACLVDDGICGAVVDSSPVRCQVCGETADLKCGPSRFGDKTWACKDCWEPDCSPDRTPQAWLDAKAEVDAGWPDTADTRPGRNTR